MTAAAPRWRPLATMIPYGSGMPLLRSPPPILTGHQGIVRRLAFVDSGKLLASGGTWDGTIRLWDVKARSPKETVNGHYGTISSVAFAPSRGAVCVGK